MKPAYDGARDQGAESATCKTNEKLSGGTKLRPPERTNEKQAGCAKFAQPERTKEKQAGCTKMRHPENTNVQILHNAPPRIN